MSTQDLQLNLVGKDVSASDALRSLARAANVAAKSAGDSLDRMNRRVETSSQQSAKSVIGGFGTSLVSWGQAGLAGIMGGIAASVTSSVMNVVADAGQAVIAQLKTSVVDYNATLENAQIGFTSMLGSGQKASKFLNDLQDFGLKTPFQTDQLIQLSQQMMGYGVSAKNVIPYLTAIGDATAAAGRTDALPQATLAFEQMAARGRVDLADMNQLTAAGVPALKILAGAYGVTTGKILEMIHSGKLMSDDALPKLISGIEHGTKTTAALGGMMEKQSATFKGAMSNISDSLNRALGTAFLPVFKVMERGAVAIQKFTTSKGFSSWANSMGRTVGVAMNRIGAAIHTVFENPAVQQAVQRLGVSLGNAFKTLGPALNRILPNMVRFGIAVLPAVINAFTGIVDKIPAVIAKLELMSTGLAALGPFVAAEIKVLSDLGGTLFNVLGAVDNFATSANSAMMTFVLNVQSRMKELVGWLGGLVGQFGTIGGQIVSGLVSGISNAWGGVMATVQGLINQIPLAARKLLGIASPSKVFRSIGRWVGEGLHQGLLGSVDQIKSTADKLSNAITDQFKAKKISKTAKDAGLFWVKQFTDGGSMLQAIAKQRATVLEKLADLKSSRSDMSTGTRDATLGAGDITSYAGPGDAVAGIRSLVAKTKLFTKDLNSLSKKGLGGTMLTQLVNGWQSDPDGALSTAQGLLANPTDLKQIIGLQKQLNTAAGALGTAAGNDVYGASIRNTSSKAMVLGWEQQAIARRDLSKIARETHVHINLSGTYAGTKADLAKTVTQVIKDEIKKGTISKDWNK